MPEPIRQKLKVEYNGKPIQDAARDQQRLAEGTREVGEQAQQATAKERSREEVTKDSARADDEARVATKNHGRELTGLTGVVDNAKIWLCTLL
jgi:rubrerythrin